MQKCDKVLVLLYIVFFLTSLEVNEVPKIHREPFQNQKRAEVVIKEELIL